MREYQWVLLVILLEISLIAAMVVLCYCFHVATVRKKVRQHSIKLGQMADLNDEIIFDVLDTNLQVWKYYDNKSNFNKIEPAYLMSAELRNNIEYYSDYFSRIRKNMEIQEIYAARIQDIIETEHPIDYEQLKISKKLFQKHEMILLEKLRKPTYSDCSMHVHMSYSSPKGRVNLKKEAVFDFEQMQVSFGSIARSRLDRQTYRALSYVERGEVSDSLRYDILNRDNFQCVICGASSREGARLHVDHIVPIAKGGKSVPGNLRTRCERCNIGKSDKDESKPVFDKTEKEPEMQDGAPVCSVCGAKMVLRKGRYSDFYGCSNYPRCKFTRQL